MKESENEKMIQIKISSKFIFFWGTRMAQVAQHWKAIRENISSGSCTELTVGWLRITGNPESTEYPLEMALHPHSP